MQQRSVAMVIVLSLVTCGIYELVWFVKTKDEMNNRGARIPTAWLIIVPFVNIWWLWKYSEGVELVTSKETSTVLAFVVLFLLRLLGVGILQAQFNKVTVASPPQAFVHQG